MAEFEATAEQKIREVFETKTQQANGHQKQVNGPVKEIDGTQKDLTAISVDKAVVETIFTSEKFTETENDHTATETLLVREKFELLKKDVSVETLEVKKTTMYEKCELDETLTSNKTVINTPDKKTIIEKVKKISIDENVTNTIAYNQKVVEDIPTHETFVQTVATNKIVTELDKDNKVIEKVTIKDFVENDVKVEIVKVEKTTVDHDLEADDAFIKTEISKKSTFETPKRVKTLTDVAVDEDTEIISPLDSASIPKTRFVHERSPSFIDLSTTAQHVKLPSLEQDTYPITPRASKDYSWTTKIPERPPQASPIAPRNWQTSTHEKRVVPISNCNSQSSEVPDDLIEKLEREKEQLNKKVEHLKKTMGEEVSEVRKRAVIQAVDEEGESSFVASQRVQTLLQPTSPSLIIVDVIESMFNPGFNSNVVLFMSIIFMLLFVCLIFLIVITDFNGHVIAFLGLSILFFLGLHWFIADIAQAQAVEALKPMSSHKSDQI
ncbi:hypothetical protein G9A89_019400 [Geosiphon pyriformis]|nr:hypothetical protein G9A89_019400 [Geosiphon pyriformis]